MTKLYEISNQLVGLRKLMDEGELDETTLRDTLDGLTGDLTVKAEGLLAYVTNLGSDASQIDTEIKRLQARKKTITNHQESLRDYLRLNMEESGIDKITCPLFTITLRKPVDVVVIESDDLIPDMFKAVVETVKVDKMAIKRHLKDNMDVPGARLEPGKRGILIK